MIEAASIPDASRNASRGDALLTTKLYIPRVRAHRSLVQRPHLVERLADGAARPLTLISAPAGSGKTTLLSEWIPQNEYCVTWLTLDEGDNDAVRFWGYVIAALQKLQAGIGNTALTWLQAQRPPLSIEPFLTILLNEIAAFPDEFSLVLDDYHVIDNTAIHESITFLLDHLPPRMHLILASRADPPLPLPRWRARDQLIELRAGELRFTSDEIAAFLNRQMGLNLSAAEVAALAARTEGWIAGLQLAGLSLRGREADDQRAFITAFTGSQRYVLDYLVEEVFNRQSANMQQFLLQTCLLERLSGSLCDAVTGQDDGERMLENLERANLFISPLDDERHWYRYHPLFADVLRHRLRQTQPAQMAELSRHASAWYEQHGFMAEAISHALAAQDVEHAAHLIETTYETMLSRNEAASLLNWLEMLPAELLQAHPQLALAKAWSLLHTTRIDQAEAWLQDTEKTIQASDTAQSQVWKGEAAAVRAMLAMIQDDVPHTIEFAEQALQSLPADRQFLRGTVSLDLGVAYFFRGDMPAARRTLNAVDRLSKTADNVLLAYFAHLGLARLDALEGHLQHASEVFHQALEIASTAQGALPMASMAHLSLSELLYQWNDLDNAVHHARLGIELGKGWWVQDEVMAGHVLLARAKQVQGDMAATEAALTQAEALAAEQYLPVLAAHVAISQLRRWIVQGHLHAAVSWANEQARTFTLGSEVSFQRLQTALGLARLQIACSKLEPVAPWLEWLQRVTVAGGLIGWTIETLILQALVFHATGDGSAALSALERALSLAEPGGYIRVFVDEGEPIQLLLEKMNASHAAGRMRPYIMLLLAAFGSQQAIHPSRDAATLPPLPEPLSARELEILQLLSDGLSNQEIAQKLVLSVGTVKVHLKHIYGKLDASSRTQALARARELNLL